jgi:hypothetical protein
MRNTSERHVRWYGETAANRQSISMTYTNALFMARGAPSVRFLSVVLYRIFIPCHYVGAGAFAFAMRSGVNLVLLLARIKKLSKCVYIPCSDASRLNLYPPREKRLSLIRHALFGSDSFRASAMLGPYHTLRIYVPL